VLLFPLTFRLWYGSVPLFFFLNKATPTLRRRLLCSAKVSTFRARGPAGIPFPEAIHFRPEQHGDRFFFPERQPHDSSTSAGSAFSPFVSSLAGPPDLFVRNGLIDRTLFCSVCGGGIPTGRQRFFFRADHFFNLHFERNKAISFGVDTPAFLIPSPDLQVSLCFYLYPGRAGRVPVSSVGG